MTYQADTNSKFNKKLLQIYILLNDEKEITYESFNEYEELDSTMYYRLMQEYQEMLSNLKLKCSIVKERIKDVDYETRYPANIYYHVSIGEDYSFSIEGLSEEKKKKYIYVIFYLMLKNNHYISRKVMSNYLNIDIPESTFKRLVDSVKEIVGFDIYKNELQSYIIEHEV